MNKFRTITTDTYSYFNGIKNVIFTNMKPKHQYLQGTDVLWHLYDDSLELFDICVNKCITFGITVNAKNWREHCEFILN